MLKKIVLSAFFILLITVVLMWQQLAAAFLGHYVQRYCQQNLGITLTYQTIHRAQEGFWIIQKPSWAGSFKGHADQILVATRLDNNKLAIILTIDDPHISIGQTDSSSFIKTSSLFSFSIGDWLKTKTSIAIPNGTLAFTDPSIAQPVQFNFKSDDTQYALHCIVDEGSLFFQVNRNNDNTQTFTINADHLNCAALDPYCGKMFPSLRWQIIQGYVHGDIKATINNDHLLTATGNVHLENMILSNPHDQTWLNIPEASCYRNEDGTGAFSFLQPAMFGIDSNSFEFKEIMGNLAIESNQDIAINLYSTCFFCDRTHPLNVRGSVNITSHHADFVINESENTLLQFKCNPKDTYQYSVDLDAYTANFLPMIPRIRVEGLLKHTPNESSAFTGNAIATLQQEHAPLTCPLELELGFVDLAPETSWWQRAANQFGYGLQQGWMQVSQYPIASIPMPQLANQSVQLEGFLDMSLAFDANSIVISYEAPQGFTCDSSLFSIKASLANPAMHYYDMSTGLHGGVADLTDTTYLHKASNIALSGIQGTALLNAEEVVFPNIEGFCSGIYAAGSLHTQFNSERPFELFVHLNTATGKVSQLHQITQALKLNKPILNCPFDGELELRDEGADLYCTSTPDGFLFQSEIHGVVSEGKGGVPVTNLSLNDLSFDFDYDSDKQTLDLIEIEGTILVGDPEHIQEYLLAGDVTLSDNLEHSSLFDLWLGDKNHDIVRMVGKTDLNPNGLVDLHLNEEISHIGNVHPKLSMQLHDWSRINQLHLHLDGKLETLWRDINHLGNLLELNLGLSQARSVRGDVSFDVNYQDQTGTWSYDVVGKEIGWDQYQYRECFLKGKKTGKIWSVDQLQLDDLSFATQFSWSDHYWKVDFLGVRIGNHLLVGLAGNYYPHDERLEASINLLEFNFNGLRKWQALHSLMAERHQNNTVRATGIMQAEWGQELPTWHAQAQLNRLTIDCNGRDLRLSTQCQYSGKPFWFVVHSELPSLKTGELTIYDQEPIEQETAPLQVEWKRDINDFTIDRVAGECMGISLNLENPHQSSSKIRLQGEVKGKSQEILSFFLPDQKLLSSGDASLNGAWEIAKEDLASWQEKTRFQGTVELREGRIFAWPFDQVTAEISYYPDKIICAKVHAKHSSGILNIPNIELDKRQNHWFTSIPKLFAENWRPLNPKDFTIQRMSLENFTGDLKDSTTFSGSGVMDCVNIPTLALPSDLSQLSPISGTCYFAIGQGKIFLNDLKDVYSLGKASRFSLAKTSEPSFIDFDGNLHIQLRMKHNSVLYKLAEKYILDITGTWSNPSCTFRLPPK